MARTRSEHAMKVLANELRVAGSVHLPSWREANPAWQGSLVAAIRTLLERREATLDGEFLTAV
jgi:hypothetical protein